MTEQGLAELEAELERLKTVDRPRIAEEIRTARGFGDLKENAEYHDAKNDQAFLETRIKRLAARLRNAEVVERGAGDGGVQVGSHVSLRDEASGRTVSYQLVGATEADVAAGRLSVESPLAQAALGRREGDVLVVRAPRGEMRYTVVAVE
jgi:transcription elongation factor GreA